MNENSPRPPLDASRIAGVVLAGGLSTRMGEDKAFVELAGRPLVAHVIDRLRPQVGIVYISARRPDDRFRALDCPLVTDPEARRGAGPLAGVAAALVRARADGFSWAATAPCDAPFLPLDLVARLAAPLASGDAPAAVAVSAFGLEPMFGLWPVAALAEIEAALDAGRASPRSVLAGMGAARVAFARGGGRDPFANLNAPADVLAAEAEFGP